MTYLLKSSLSPSLSLNVWERFCFLLFDSLHCLGLDEGEFSPPEGEESLVAGPHDVLLNTADEFVAALHPETFTLPELPPSFRAYFETQQQAETAKSAFLSLLEETSECLKDLPHLEIHPVEDQDYDALYKSSFQPLTCPPFWDIRAPWHGPSPHADRLTVWIEPGMAFGTGTHETTQGCLELYGQIYNAPSPLSSHEYHVLDFGCGSGILALGALRLRGSKGLSCHAWGLDIDPLSLAASQRNAALNNVTLTTGMALAEIPPPLQFDLIFANILKNTLLEWVPTLLSRLKPGGHIILSGLWKEQHLELQKALDSLTSEKNPHWPSMELQQSLTKGEWSSLLYKRRTDS